jgi:hypothetical protein
MAKIRGIFQQPETAARLDACKAELSGVYQTFKVNLGQIPEI